MDNIPHARLIEAVARAVIGHAEELTALDQAIGDGDHGLNMKRGAEAVLAQIDALAAQPLPEALTGVGTTLVMKVGGASGPLYGHRGGEEDRPLAGRAEDDARRARPRAGGARAGRGRNLGARA